MSALNSLPMKTVDPMESVTMIISRFESGTHEVYNIIPDEAHIEGNIRSHDTSSSKKLLKRVQETAEGICEAFGCECRFIGHDGYPALSNDEALAADVRGTLVYLGIDARSAKPVMGAEDFGFYTQERPGLYMNVGTRDPENPATEFSPHNPHFCIDESALGTAFKTLLGVYARMTGHV